MAGALALIVPRVLNDETAAPEIVLADNALVARPLPIWTAAREAFETKRARVAFIGDSTTAGLGSGPSLYEEAKARSWPTQLATLLSERGLPAQAASFFGESGFSTNAAAADPRIGMGPGWVTTSSIAVPGGGAFANPNTSDPLTFRPGSPADTVVVYDAPEAFTAVMTLAVNGRPIESQARTAPNGFRVTTATFPYEIAPSISYASEVDGGAQAAARVVGMEVYDSAAAEVALWNMGYSGSMTSHWVGLASYGPDLTFICLGINDLGQNVPVETYERNIRTIAATAKRSGDVVLIVPNRIDPGAVPLARQKAYEQALERIAAEMKLPLIRVPAMFGEFAAAAPFMFDDVHPNAAGYRKIAEAAAVLMLR